MWGIVNGVLDSTVKAVVAELVQPDQRAIAYGWLALVRGLGLVVAGAVIGVAYDQDRALAIWLVVGINVVAFATLWRVLRRIQPAIRT